MLMSTTTWWSWCPGKVRQVWEQTWLLANPKSWSNKPERSPFRAVEHPRVPETQEFVRVHSYQSKMVIRPHKSFDEVWGLFRYLHYHLVLSPDHRLNLRACIYRMDLITCWRTVTILRQSFLATAWAGWCRVVSVLSVTTRRLCTYVGPAKAQHYETIVSQTVMVEYFFLAVWF